MSTCCVSSIVRVVVDQSSLHRSAVLRIGVLPPGIFLMASVGLERDFLVLFGELKFAWRQVKGIWCRGYYCLVILDGSVQCQLLRNRAPSPRFLSPYLLGLPLVISPEWGLDWHILRKLPWEILLPPATSKFEPQTLTTHHLYCKSLQYLRDGYIHYVHYIQTLSPGLKL